MGKNRKSDIEILDTHFNQIVKLDSLEEWQVYNWVLELVESGAILEYEYQPTEFQLTDKITYVPYYGNPKHKAKSLLQSHEYTADFRLVFDEKFGELISSYFRISEDMVSDGKITIYIDVKGTFQQNGGARSFSINQKMVYEKFGIYVQKTIPQELFQKFGIPVRCLKGYKGRPSKIYSGYMLARNVFAKK